MRVWESAWLGGAGWFRIFGVGLAVKDTRSVPLWFSERNGFWHFGASTE